MNAHRAAFLEMRPAEIIPHNVNVYVQFIRNTLRTAAGQFVLDSAQLVKCNYPNP